MSFVPDEAIKKYTENPDLCSKDLEGITNAYGQPAAPRTARRWMLYLKQNLIEAQQTLKSAYQFKPDPEKTLIRRTPPTPTCLQAAVFDIETTDFKSTGYKGHLLCASLVELTGSDVTTYAIKFEDDEEDHDVLEAFVAALSEYEFVIGHNIANFDLPWTLSRIMYHRLPTPPCWWYLDTYQAARSLNIKAERKSMDNLLDYFALHTRKTKVYAEAWHNVRSRDKEKFDGALNEITSHCEGDVLDNRDLFNVMRPYLKHLRPVPWKHTKW